jgi:hypothetical protein
MQARIEVSATESILKPRETQNKDRVSFKTCLSENVVSFISSQNGLFTSGNVPSNDKDKFMIHLSAAQITVAARSDA